MPLFKKEIIKEGVWILLARLGITVIFLAMFIALLSAVSLILYIKK